MVLVHDLSVGGVFVSKSGKRFGSFWLRGFQERVLSIIGGFVSGGVGPGVVLVSAPTGAGKSLCLLLGYEVFREAGLRGFGCLGLYPSNELLDDQFRSVGNIVERALGYGLSVFGDWRDRVFRLYVGPGGEKLVLARISGRILGELGETGGFRGLGHLDMLVRISGELMRIDPDYSVVLATPDLFYYVLLGVYGDYERTARYISSILEGVEPRITGLKDRLARLGTVNLRLGSKPIVFFDEYHSWGLLDYLSSLALVKLFAESGSLTILSTATPIPGIEKHLEALDVPVVGKVEESGSGGGDLVKLPARITFYWYGRGDAVEAGRPGLINIYTVQKLMSTHVRLHSREAVEYAEKAGAQALVVLDRISYTLETSAVLEELLGGGWQCIVNVTGGSKGVGYCGRCPACLIYGFAVQGGDYNVKSRVEGDVYYAVVREEDATFTFTRNAVDEALHVTGQALLQDRAVKPGVLFVGKIALKNLTWNELLLVLYSLATIDRLGAVQTHFGRVAVEIAGLIAAPYEVGSGYEAALKILSSAPKTPEEALTIYKGYIREIGKATPYAKYCISSGIAETVRREADLKNIAREAWSDAKAKHDELAKLAGREGKKKGKK